RGLANADGVIVDSGSDANHSGVIPDAVGHAVFGCPLIFIVPAGVGIGADNVHLTGGQTGEGTAVRVRLHRVGQVGDILVVVFLEPQRGVDVSGGRGGVGHTPVGTAHILPGEGLSGIDFCGQFLPLLEGPAIIQARELVTCSVVSPVGAVAVQALAASEAVDRAASVAG